MVKFGEDLPTKPDPIPMDGQEILVIELDWRALIIDFIINNKSYPYKNVHERLSRRASNYVVNGNKLLKHSVSSGTLVKCILGTMVWPFFTKSILVSMETPQCHQPSRVKLSILVLLAYGRC